ncbi:MAG: hypothetical protein AAF693_00865 [Bacteroidota bacterium]
MSLNRNLLQHGMFVSKLLHNRGRLRNAYSKVVTSYYKRIFERIMAGRISLPIKDKKSVFPAISFTTWEPRIHALPLVLINLIEQRPMPSVIYVWLTQHDYDKINPDVIRIFSKSIVEFLITEDFGPHKKWFPLVESGFTDPFVFCDDDTYYPNGWYRALLESDDKNSYVGHNCHYMNKSNDGLLLGYNLWEKNIHTKGLVSHNIFPVGCGGVLLYPNRIAHDFRSSELISELCPMGDDIWLKLAHLVAGIPCKKSDYLFPYIEYQSTQGFSLMKTNVEQNQNDVQMNDVIEYFNISLADIN